MSERYCIAGSLEKTRTRLRHTAYDHDIKKPSCFYLVSSRNRRSVGIYTEKLKSGHVGKQTGDLVNFHGLLPTHTMPLVHSLA